MLENNGSTLNNVKISELHLLATYPESDVIRWFNNRDDWVKGVLSKILRLK